jgi:hypothetical protein
VSPFCGARAEAVLSRPVSDLADYSSCRRLFLFPQREFLLRRLRSSFRWAALLIRLTDLMDQNVFPIYRQTLGNPAANNWRRHVAASIPAIYTLLLLLAWVLPIQQFLFCTLHSEAWLPLLALPVRPNQITEVTGGLSWRLT